jgi:folate-dependent phosphoribosylglycinamide formyltransferase PurN
MYEAVQDAITDGSLDARISFVFSNRDRHDDPVTDSFFERVDANGIPLHAKSSVAYRKAAGGDRSRPDEPLPAWREAYDREISELISGHRVDVGVLAGYMLIFTSPFVERFPLLNLHPALPTGPIGTWREVILELIRTNASETGVMVHLAIPAVDRGPVVSYCRYSIDGPVFAAARQALGDTTDLDDYAIEASELFGLVREAGVRCESPFLVELLQAFADGRVTIEDGSIVYQSGRAPLPVDITPEVEARLAGQHSQ